MLYGIGHKFGSQQSKILASHYEMTIAEFIYFNWAYDFRGDIAVDVSRIIRKRIGIYEHT